MQNTRYSCQILMKLEFSPLIFEKYSDVKFHAIRSGRIQAVPGGQTDGRTDGQT